MGLSTGRGSLPSFRVELPYLLQSGLRCSGCCVDYPLPPCPDLHVLHPSSTSLRKLRAQSAWTLDFLHLLSALLRLTHVGTPVSLRVRIEGTLFEPISAWLTQLAEHKPEQARPTCFTLEFVAMGTSF